MNFNQLPSIGGALDGGTFVGLTTTPDGTHCAVVLLPGKVSSLNWHDAKAWATEQGGELPSRSVAALLFANVKDQLIPAWHWIADESDASYAWGCVFLYGSQYLSLKSHEGLAVAVRLISLGVDSRAGTTPTVQDKAAWAKVPQGFNEWWNSDYSDESNPFRINSAAYWALAGWSEAMRVQAQGVPDIDYEALIAAAYNRDKRWAQGTNGCIAFKHGAEWFRDQCLSAAPPPAHPRT